MKLTFMKDNYAALYKRLRSKIVIKSAPKPGSCIRCGRRVQDTKPYCSACIEELSRTLQDDDIVAVCIECCARLKWKNARGSLRANWKKEFGPHFTMRCRQDANGVLRWLPNPERKGSQ